MDVCDQFITSHVCGQATVIKLVPSVFESVFTLPLIQSYTPVFQYMRDRYFGSILGWMDGVQKILSV